MTAHDPRLLAWAYLSRVVQGPSAYMSMLIDELGVDETARAVRDGDLPPAIGEKTRARAHIDTAQRDLDLMEAMGGRLVTPNCTDWPAWRMLSFDGLDPSGGETAPFVLWVLGSGDLVDLTERSVGIVGTRASTAYGEHVTAEIAG